MSGPATGGAPAVPGADLSQEVLHLLDRLGFQPRIRSRSGLAGRHASRLSGTSTDFLEYRAYAPGEPAGQVDWRATARRDRPLVRKKEHRGLLQAWLVPDASASMLFPEGGPGKHHAQVLLAGLLGHLLTGQGDSVGLLLERPGGAPLVVEPRRTLEGVAGMLRALSAFSPAGADPGTAAACARLRERLSRPSLVFVFGDLDAGADPLVEPVRDLARRGHDVRFLFLLHPWEADPPWRGSCLFSDLEGTRPDRLLRPEELRETWRDVHREHVDSSLAALAAAGAACAVLDVTRPAGDLLRLVCGQA